MAKRRTKKQKASARHTFTYSWDAKAKNADFKPDVKRQIRKPKKLASTKAGQAKKAKISAKDEDITKIKRDIVKSLIYAGIILGMEIVIYLAWSGRQV